MVVYVSMVEPQDNYKLLVTFENNEKKLFDCTELLNRKIYEPLKNKAFFNNVHVEYGTAVWNEKIDIAPEHLYDNGISI